MHFYTAATRKYGELCLEILKLELKRTEETQQLDNETNQNQKQIDISCAENRLITRDDKDRFS